VTTDVVTRIGERSTVSEPITREEIAAWLESLALDAGTSDLGDARDLLNYIAATIRTGAEKPIIEVLELVTEKAMKRLHERDREEDHP
jgi:hypothetical protein